MTFLQLLRVRSKDGTVRITVDGHDTFQAIAEMVGNPAIAVMIAMADSHSLHVDSRSVQARRYN